MQTVDHNIRACLIAILWEIRVKTKMRSMGFINNEWNTFFMDRFRYCFYIRYNAVIRRRHDNDRTDSGNPFKSPSHILCRNFCIKLNRRIHSRRQIHRIQPVHLDSVIHGLVAISCHKHGIASIRHTDNST